MQAKNWRVLSVFVIGWSLTLAWLHTTGTALSAPPHDLSEWMTLHPVVRAISPILLPALLLRLTLLITGWLALLTFKNAPQNWHWLLWIIVGAIFFVLLPPIAFFRGEWQDINYQQHALLWIFYALGVFVLMLKKQVAAWWTLILASIGVIVGSWGILWAQNMMLRYEIDVALGLGGGIYLLGQILLITSVLSETKTGKP